MVKKGFVVLKQPEQQQHFISERTKFVMKPSLLQVLGREISIINIVIIVVSSGDQIKKR